MGGRGGTMGDGRNEVTIDYHHADHHAWEVEVGPWEMGEMK